MYARCDRQLHPGNPRPARLDHENLVRAYDAGEDGNVYYLVTEYVPGSDLRKLVRSHGPLEMTDAASVIAQIACGLQHAHEQGLVHRDVKPGNILVTPEGRAKLSDLGLAGPLTGGVEADPRFGRIVGTADYLSPDHIQMPRDPKPAWDIYSLGCTLYYAVTGKVPFPGGTTADKAQAHLRLHALDPRRLNPLLENRFVEVIADMMAKNPAQRIPSAAEVAARLTPWVDFQSAGWRREGRVMGVAAAPASVDGLDLSAEVVQELGDMEDTVRITDLPEIPACPKEDLSRDLANHPSHGGGDRGNARGDGFERARGRSGPAFAGTSDHAARLPFGGRGRRAAGVVAGARPLIPKRFPRLPKLRLPRPRLKLPAEGLRANSAVAIGNYGLRLARMRG